VKVASLDEHGQRLDMARVVELLELDPQSPPLPDGIAAWQSSDHG
jgi:hypothetical protein